MRPLLRYGPARHAPKAEAPPRPPGQLEQRELGWAPPPPPVARSRRSAAADLAACRALRAMGPSLLLPPLLLLCSLLPSAAPGEAVPRLSLGHGRRAASGREGGRAGRSRGLNRAGARRESGGCGG